MSYAGLYGKYKIEKADGSPMDPDADYFFLRLDKDPHALVALSAYAESIKKENPQLCEDLKRKVKEYNNDTTSNVNN